MNEETLPVQQWTPQQFDEYHRTCFNGLDAKKRQDCVDWLRAFLDRTTVSERDDARYAGLSLAAAVRKLYAENGREWWVGHHFWWGMWMRNQLRTHGFGEKFFEIDNLDDYYIPLIECALRINGYEE